MTTRSVVPRVDNEGGIGENVTPKYWQDGFFYNLYLKGLPWVDVGVYDSFSDAIDGIGTSEKTLVIASEEAVTDDKTVPLNVTLKFFQGGSINVSTGKTVTINGHVEAELYQIFKGSGSIAFGAGVIKEVYPEWWTENTTPGTTDMTAAIQAAFYSGIGTVSLQGTTYLHDPLTLQNPSDYMIKIRGVPFNFQTVLKYSASADADSGSISNKTTPTNGILIENITLDTNSRAKYGFYLASDPTGGEAIKNIVYRGVYVINLKAAAVGWQIGDETNTGLDTDAWNHTWYNCHARSGGGANGGIGWIIDGQNAYNSTWYNCSAGRQSGYFMECGIRLLRGSSAHVYNYTGDLLQTGGANTWTFDSRAGSLAVHGMYTEDHRVAYATSGGQHDSQLLLSNIEVNESDNNGEKSIDTDVPTVLTDCIFSTGAYHREIDASGKLVTTNVDIGGADAKYTLGSPERCILEGHAIGTLESLVHNAAFSDWRGAAVDDPPLGWAKSTDGGTLTIQQSTTGANIGAYSVAMVVSAGASSGVAGITSGAVIDVTPFRGRRISFFAIGTRTGTETGQIMSVSGTVTGTTDVTGGAVNFYDSASGGVFFCYGFMDVATNETYISIKLGFQNAATGTAYFDYVGISPRSWASYTPALKIVASYPSIEHNANILASGYVPLGSNGSCVMGLDTAAPTSGTWVDGDIVWNSAPAAGGAPGWVCTTPGSPGTWKAMANLAA